MVKLTFEMIIQKTKTNDPNKVKKLDIFANEIDTI
jgi:hypothetical protein